MSCPPVLNGNEQTPRSNRFESDTKKLVRLHLQNKDHVITDEEIRNLRVGMVPAEQNGADQNDTRYRSAPPQRP